MFDFLKTKREPPILPDGTVRRHFSVRGHVQGVGFRYRASYAARALGLTGWVRNEPDSSVTMEVQGLPEQIDQLLPTVSRSDYIEITDLRVKEIPTNPWERSFGILDAYF